MLCEDCICSTSENYCEQFDKKINLKQVACDKLRVKCNHLEFCLENKKCYFTKKKIRTDYNEELPTFSIDEIEAELKEVTEIPKKRLPKKLPKKERPVPYKKRFKRRLTAGKEKQGRKWKKMQYKPRISKEYMPETDKTEKRKGQHKKWQKKKS
jgi:hypothetical protein